MFAVERFEAGRIVPSSSRMSSDGRSSGVSQK
jgi:hypothetical protein